MDTQKAYRYRTVILENVQGKQHYTREETKDKIKMHVSIKGKLNPQFRKLYYIEKHNLFPLIESISFYTQNIENKNNFIERIYWILNDISETPKCQVCQVKTVFFRYNLNGSYNKYCSHSCSGKINYPTSHFNDAELAVYKIKMKTCRPGYTPSTEAKIKMSISACNAQTIAKKKKACLERYGVENAGVLGAYHSKAACTYIKQYIIDNNLDESCCYFHGGGVSGKEFFQMITIPLQVKKRYVSYDLVVFNDAKAALEKNLSKLTYVLEYNGSWHYTREMIKGHENEPSVPYKRSTNITTKEQSVILDEAKLAHVKPYATYVYVYWEKTKTLEKVK